MTPEALIILAIVFSIYLAPSFVAQGRKHTQVNPIVVVNLFLGWTFVGWVVALAWAFMEDNREDSLK